MNNPDRRRMSDARWSPAANEPNPPVLKRNPGRGQPRYVPTKEQRDLIKVMIGYGIPQERCRLLIRGTNGKPVSLGTFQRAFADEIAVGTIEMDTIAVTMLATKIRQGDLRAIVWYMANRMRWKDFVHQDRTTTEESSLVIRIEPEDLARRLEERGLPTSLFGADAPTPVLELSNGSDAPLLDQSGDGVL